MLRHDSTKRTRWLCWIALTACCYLQPIASWRLQDESHVVVPLTDKNFEHETQASTGQTTGSWLVWFSKHDDDESIWFGRATSNGEDGEEEQQDENALPDASVWSEHNLVLATMNGVGSGADTARRFGFTPESLPTFIYVHNKGKVYPIPKPDQSSSYYHWKDLLAFCLSPDPALSQDIPKPLDLWSEILAKVQEDKSYMMIVGAIIMVFVFIMWVVAMVGHFGGDLDSSDRKRK